MSEWDGIQGAEGWSKKLSSLLKEAKSAAQVSDLDVRLKMSERLILFIEESRPNTPEILALDKIADETASALLKQSIEERLIAISERTAAYERFSKEFQGQAEKNKAEAKSIRLKGIIKTVNSATETIEAIKSLKDSLKDSANDRKVAQAIDQTVSAIEKLRSQVAKLV